MKFIQINTAHQQQLDSIKNYISDVKKTASSDSDSTEIYGELLKKVIVHENKTAAFYLNYVSFGFRIQYHICSSMSSVTYTERKQYADL